MPVEIWTYAAAFGPGGSGTQAAPMTDNNASANNKRLMMNPSPKVWSHRSRSRRVDGTTFETDSHRRVRLRTGPARLPCSSHR